MLGGAKWNKSGLLPYAIWEGKDTTGGAATVATRVKLTNLIVGSLVFSYMLSMGL